MKENGEGNTQCRKWNKKQKRQAEKWEKIIRHSKVNGEKGAVDIKLSRNDINLTLFKFQIRK